MTKEPLFFFLSNIVCMKESLPKGTRGISELDSSSIAKT